MKIEVKVTEVTHEDLVNLLCTASYGSQWLCFATPIGTKDGLDIVEGDCREDVWAKALLAGKKIFVDDCYAEDADDFYGNLPHKFFGRCCLDGTTYMRYDLTLEDIKNGLSRALSSGTYIADYARHLWEEEAMNIDQPEAEALIQYIVFGKEIYG
jgi:hypothetical protein